MTFFHCRDVYENLLKYLCKLIINPYLVLGWCPCFSHNRLLGYLQNLRFIMSHPSVLFESIILQCCMSDTSTWIYCISQPNVHVGILLYVLFCFNADVQLLENAPFHLIWQQPSRGQILGSSATYFVLCRYPQCFTIIKLHMLPFQNGEMQDCFPKGNMASHFSNLWYSSMFHSLVYREAFPIFCNSLANLNTIYCT